MSVRSLLGVLAATALMAAPIHAQTDDPAPRTAIELVFETVEEARKKALEAAGAVETEQKAKTDTPDEEGG